MSGRPGSTRRHAGATHSLYAERAGGSPVIGLTGQTDGRTGRAGGHQTGWSSLFIEVALSGSARLGNGLTLAFSFS